MGHKDPVSFVGNIKGDVLIGLLRGSAPVLVPHLHGLAVLHKGGIPLSQSVNILAHV